MATRVNVQTSTFWEEGVNPGSKTRRVAQENSLWSCSPRKKGRLNYKTNSCEMRKIRLLTSGWKANGNRYDAVWRNNDSSIGHFIPTSLRSRARERFNSRVKDGASSLAVTLAQIDKAGSMVNGRLLKIDRMFQQQEQKWAKRKRLPKRWNNKVQTTASNVLEGMFGWAPLVSEVNALATTAFTQAFPPIKITARVSGYDLVPRQTISGVRHTYTGKSTVTCAAYTYVTNPNRLLASRLGLSDVAAAAWDVVPWSWVAGMFINVGAVLGQFTALEGITLGEASTTATAQYRRTSTGSDGQSINFLYHKSRTMGLPPVHLRFKSPAPSWGLAAITASVIGQRCNRIEAIINNLKPKR